MANIVSYMVALAEQRQADTHNVSLPASPTSISTPSNVFVPHIKSPLTPTPYSNITLSKFRSNPIVLRFLS